MKNVKENLKRTTKGAIELGLAGYCMNEFVNRVVCNPAIPFIPKLASEIVFVGADTVVLALGLRNLFGPERYRLSNESEDFTNKEKDEFIERYERFRKEIGA